MTATQVFTSTGENVRLHRTLLVCLFFSDHDTIRGLVLGASVWNRSADHQRISGTSKERDLYIQRDLLLSLNPALLFCFPCWYLNPLHTEVTVRTLADSTCLKRLFRSCMLGDLGRGMRGDLFFSVTDVAALTGV